MVVALMPRLKPAGFDTALARTLQNGSPAGSSLSVLSAYSDVVTFAPSGGYKANTVAAVAGEELRDIARRAGFPTPKTQITQAEFDRLASIYLAQVPELQTGEALRNDVWAFLTTVIAPDVVSWRFPGESRARFAGGNRNAFQRLWIRGVTLDRGKDHCDRWGLLDSLSEDAMVAIFERPSIASSKHFALAVAEGWAQTLAKTNRNQMEDIMRRAIKILLIRNQIIDLSWLDSAELQKEITLIFDSAI